MIKWLLEYFLGDLKRDLERKTKIANEVIESASAIKPELVWVEPYDRNDPALYLKRAEIYETLAFRSAMAEIEAEKTIDLCGGVDHLKEKAMFLAGIRYVSGVFSSYRKTYDKLIKAKEMGKNEEI